MKTLHDAGFRVSAGHVHVGVGGVGVAVVIVEVAVVELEPLWPLSRYDLFVRFACLDLAFLLLLSHLVIDLQHKIRIKGHQ